MDTEGAMRKFDPKKPAPSLAVLNARLRSMGVTNPLYRSPAGYYYWGGDILERGARHSSVYIFNQNRQSVEGWKRDWDLALTAMKEEP